MIFAMVKYKNSFKFSVFSSFFKSLVENCLTAKQTFERLIQIQTDNAALTESSNLISHSVDNVIHTRPVEISTSVQVQECLHLWILRSYGLILRKSYTHLQSP